MNDAVDFRAYVSPEDHGRANFYALISRLFASAPDQALLQAIASSIMGKRSRWPGQS
jgi:hypothetical protein